jgi:hypothetical protein
MLASQLSRDLTTTFLSFIRVLVDQALKNLRVMWTVLVCSSGVRNIRMALSYLGVLYTGLPESPKQFSRFSLQDRCLKAAKFKERSERRVTQRGDP